MATKNVWVPDLNEVQSRAVTATRRRKVFAGWTNAGGTARLNALLSDAGRYHYAVTVCAFEDLGGNQVPAGVGDAVIVTEGLIVAPHEAQPGVLQKYELA